jgi:hypothetical protein
MEGGSPESAGSLSIRDTPRLGAPPRQLFASIGQRRASGAGRRGSTSSGTSLGEQLGRALSRLLRDVATPGEVLSPGAQQRPIARGTP